MTVPDSNKKLYLNVITWARLNQPRSLRWFMVIYVSPSLPTLLNVILRHGMETYTKKMQNCIILFCNPFGRPLQILLHFWACIYTWTQWNGPMLKRMEKKCEEGCLERVKLCWNSSKTPKNNDGKGFHIVWSRLYHTMQGTAATSFYCFSLRVLESSRSTAYFCQWCSDKPHQEIWLLNVPGSVYHRCFECN